MLGIVATLLLGCAGTEVEAPPPEPVPEPAPEPMPEPAPAAGEAMTVDALNADQANQVGKSVSVKGFYSNMTKQDTPPQINVMIFQDAELAAGKVMCVFDVAKEADLGAVMQKAEITVTGTVAAEKFFDSAKLEGCSMAAAGGEAPPADDHGKAKGGGGEGKTGKKVKTKAH